MSKHQPSVPPASRTPNGPGGADSARDDDSGATAKEQNRQRNLAQQGRQGNIRQNTTHQGYQQDR